MFVLVIIFLLVAIIALLTIYIRRNPYDEIPTKREKSNCANDCNTCIDICSSSKILQKQIAAFEYFNDEELDAFVGVNGDNYTTDQTEVFRNIFESLPTKDVSAWVESLRRRNIEIPNSLKDEIIMIVKDS